MPPAVQSIAKALPIYHSLTALKTIAIKGLGLEFIAGDLLYLFIFGTAMLGLSLVTFRFAKE